MLPQTHQSAHIYLFYQANEYFHVDKTQFDLGFISSELDPLNEE